MYADLSICHKWSTTGLDNAFKQQHGQPHCNNVLSAFVCCTDSRIGTKRPELSRTPCSVCVEVSVVICQGLIMLKGRLYSWMLDGTVDWSLESIFQAGTVALHLLVTARAMSRSEQTPAGSAMCRAYNPDSVSANTTLWVSIASSKPCKSAVCCRLSNLQAPEIRPLLVRNSSPARPDHRCSRHSLNL